MPAKGTKRITPAQRAQLAAGKVEGKSHRQIAKEMGLSQSTVDKQINDARTGSIFLDYKFRQAKKWEASLKVAHQNLDRLMRSKDEIIKLRASVSVMKASTYGDVAIRPDPLNDPNANRRRGDFTLEELTIAFIRGVEQGAKS